VTGGGGAGGVESAFDTLLQAILKLLIDKFSRCKTGRFRPRFEINFESVNFGRSPAERIIF